jgi:flagellar assembly protein FliH
MSCKILSGGAAARAEEIDWPAAGSPPGRAASGRHNPAPAASSPAAEEAIESLVAARAAGIRDAAYRQGESDGYQRASAELAPVLDRLARSIAEVAALRPRIRRETERDLVELSLLIARRVLRREVSVDPDAVCGLLHAALDKTSLRDVVEVRTHPGHKAALEQRLRALDATARITLKPDPRLEPGAVVVETLHGEIDASLETQLSEIQRGMADLLEAPGSRP